MICIVDDDESVLRALSRLVESMGMQAQSFTSPEELLRHGPSPQVDCFLLDIHLPGMDGFELLERVVERGIQRPVIFLTAHPDQAKRARAATAGAVACLEKPFDEQTLWRALELAIRPTGDGKRRPGRRQAQD